MPHLYVSYAGKQNPYVYTFGNYYSPNKIDILDDIFVPDGTCVTYRGNLKKCYYNDNMQAANRKWLLQLLCVWNNTRTTPLVFIV